MLTLRRSASPASHVQVQGSVLTFDDGLLRVWECGVEVACVQAAEVAAVELAQASSPTKDAAAKAYSVADKRKQHPSAYAKWTDEEEQRLLARVQAGASMEDLVREFGRQRSALVQRLNRLGELAPD